MKIIKLTESDLQRIVKKVVNEQLLNDYQKIKDYVLQQKGVTKINDNKFQFKNPDGSSQFIEFSDNKIKTYTQDRKGVKTQIEYPENLDGLMSIMSAEN